MATIAPAMPIGSRSLLRPTLFVALVAACIAALIQSFFIPLDCDVSWLITVNEKLLAGQRAYVDFIEVNPPASIWLYTPAVWIAHLLRLRPEAVVASIFMTGALASIALTLRISSRLGRPPNALVLVGILSFVDLILPMGTFAQREHAALLMTTPVLASLAVLAERRDLSLLCRIVVGVLAGLVIVLKPHFALAIVPPAAFASWRSARLEPFVPAAAAGSAVVATYAMAILLLASAYLRLVPMIAAAYLPLREQWSILLAGPVVVVPLAIYALALVLRAKRVPALAAMFLIASLGFAAGAVLQGKGYLNHALPGMALGFVGLVLLASEPAAEPARRKFVVAAAGALALLELYAMASIRPLPGLAETVTAVAPPRPSVITLGPDLLTGHPLVRNIDGRWGGSRAGLFIAVGAHRQLAEARGVRRERLLRWQEEDLDAFAADVQRGRPDVILVDARPELGWLREENQVQRVMAAYRARARAGDVQIWVRR